MAVSCWISSPDGTADLLHDSHDGEPEEGVSLVCACVFVVDEGMASKEKRGNVGV